MNTPATRPASYDDLVDLPDNVVGEIIAGELITHPRPSPKHALAASAIGSAVFSRFDRSSPDGPGGWWILDEPECHLGNDVAPDWVCEIISPSTHKYDRSTKRDVYAREHISHYWIVDPVERLIEVFELVDSRWVLVLTAQDDLKVSLMPFEGIPFDLGRLWA